MKYGISGENGIETLMDLVIDDLKGLQLNKIQVIELRFRLHPFYKISDLKDSMNKIQNFIRDRDIKIIFKTEEDKSISTNEYYLETKYSKKLSLTKD